MNYGVALINLGKTFEGIDAYRKAIEINPNYLEALNNIGAVYHGLKRHAEAKEYWEKCLEIDPEFSLAISNMKLVQDV